MDQANNTTADLAGAAVRLITPQTSSIVDCHSIRSTTAIKSKAFVVMMTFHFSSFPLCLLTRLPAQMEQPDREEQNLARACLARGSSAVSCHSALQRGGMMLSRHRFDAGSAAACCLCVNETAVGGTVYSHII